MLTTREVRRCSLGKEGAPRNTCLHWFALALEKTRFIPNGHHNRLEQTRSQSD